MSTIIDVIATDVSYQEFLTEYEGVRAEWIQGTVIKMASIDKRHDALTAFFRILLSTYLEETTGGRVLQDPMIMRLGESVGRAPDIQVLLPESLDKLKQKEVEGPADLVIEVVSPGSYRTDRIEKYDEYERHGIKEYWIIDFTYKEALFYQLGDNGLYERQELDENSVYQSAVLDKLYFSVNMLWQEQLPTTREVLQMIEAML